MERASTNLLSVLSMDVLRADGRSRWRIAIAKQALLSGAKSLDRIADEIGYESASAFSTAFSKRLGCSPGRFARTHSVGGSAGMPAIS